MRDEAICAAYRRGLRAAKLAETYGLSTRRIEQIVAAARDLPSIPRSRIPVDAGEEVRRTLAALEQAITDLGEIVGNVDAPVHVRLGAISRTLDAHERRLKLMAAAGYVSSNLAAPLVEQEMVKLTQTVADILRRHQVPEEVIGELVMTAKQRMRAPVIEAEALAA
jgi:hypothetical protein